MRRPLQFLTDVAILAAAFIVAYLPAINIQLSDFYLNTALTQVSFVVLVEISVLFLLGAYSIIWRYISVSDVKVFVLAGLISGTILATLRFALGFTDFNLWQVPLSVIFIQTVRGYGGLLAVRVLRRLVYESRDKNKFGSSKRKARRSRVLLVGAGRTGAAISREVSGRADAEVEIWGFVDDDNRKKGGSVSGYKVRGSIAELPRLVSEMSIDEVVLTLDDAKGKEI